MAEILSKSGYQHPPLATKPEPDKRFLAAFQEGFQQGLDFANTLAETDFNRHQQQLQDLLQSLPEAIATHRRQLSEELAPILLDIVQAFFIHQAKNPKIWQAALDTLLHRVKDQQQIVLALHPNTQAYLQHQDWSLPASIQMVTDDSLRLGGCRIHTEQGLFDASIEGQIERLKDTLLELQKGLTHE